MNDHNAADPPSLDRYLSTGELREFVLRAKAEDMGPRSIDITSQAIVPDTQPAHATLRSRQPGRLAGAALLPVIAEAYGNSITIQATAHDSQPIEAGATIAQLAGPLRSILAMERVALNLLTHLSGIATLTSRYVEAAVGTKTQIFDTRKTLPGLRALEKYAVACGGGHNHRFGLYDAMLVKDNHLAHLKPNEIPVTLQKAFNHARAAATPPTFIEVEVDTLEQLENILANPVSSMIDVILLDNMTPDQLRQAVAMRDRLAASVLLEASGGIGLNNVAQIAHTGVDRIAVGAITHSAPVPGHRVGYPMNRHSNTSSSSESPSHHAPTIDSPTLDLLLHQREPITIETIALRQSTPPKIVLRELDRLRAAGCRIETHPQHGITLTTCGIGAWSDYLRWSLGNDSRRIVEVYHQTTSTQDAARRIVESCGIDADGAVAIADEQTAGRGRLGRRWEAPPGTAVMFTRVSMLTPSKPSIDRLTLASTVGIAQAIEAVIKPTAVQIKWPNDLLINGSKAAGILVETFTTPAAPGHVCAIIGVGINVSVDPQQLTLDRPNVRKSITSLNAVNGAVERIKVLAEALRCIDQALTHASPESLLDQWRRRCPLLSQPLRLESGGKIVQGQVIDLDPTTGLIVRTDQGTVVQLPAATTTVL